MSKVQMLRSLVNQRLTAAVEEVFLLFEGTIAEYEEQLRRSKEENHRQQKLLDAVLNPEVLLHRTDFPEEAQKLAASEDEMSTELQESDSFLNQEITEAPQFKEEPDEFLSSRGGKRYRRLENADKIKVTFVPVPVKNENDEEKPDSQLQQRQTELMETPADGENCAEAAAWCDDPERHLQPKTEVKREDASEAETDDSAGWRETTEHQPGENRVENVKKKGNPWKKKQYPCSECGRIFPMRKHLVRHMILHTGEKPGKCSKCGELFSQQMFLDRHMKKHLDEKPDQPECGEETDQTNHMLVQTAQKFFSCAVCGKTFTCKSNLARHRRAHTGGKPFGCPICRKTFGAFFELNKHKKTHSKKKGPFKCSVCGKKYKILGFFVRHQKAYQGREHVTLQCSSSCDLKTHKKSYCTKKIFACSVCGEKFARRCAFTQHMTAHKKEHPGERPFSCPECGKGFIFQSVLNRHMLIHTKQKPFGCSECGKKFTLKSYLRKHMVTHSEEKPFSCSECGKSFGRRKCLKFHQSVHLRKKAESLGINTLKQEQEGETPQLL